MFNVFIYIIIIIFFIISQQPSYPLTCVLLSVFALSEFFKICRDSIYCIISISYCCVNFVCKMLSSKACIGRDHSYYTGVLTVTQLEYDIQFFIFNPSLSLLRAGPLKGAVTGLQWFSWDLAAAYVDRDNVKPNRGGRGQAELQYYWYTVHCCNMHCCLYGLLGIVIASYLSLLFFSFSPSLPLPPHLLNLHLLQRSFLLSSLPLSLPHYPLPPYPSPLPPSLSLSPPF